MPRDGLRGVIWWWMGGVYDKITYPDKVRLNCYYYRHYSFVKDIQMIFCTVLGRTMEYAGEVI